MNNNIHCLPVDDLGKRFLLGKKGKSEMLAIGLNPSTANSVFLDPTSRNIETIANQNGCDGWWIVNLYPERTSIPKKLPKKPNNNLLLDNNRIIKEVINDPKYNLKIILFCWGNHIEHHLYLKNQVLDIFDLFYGSDFKFYCIGKTKLGNPFHPSPMAINSFLGGINGLKLIEY